MARELNIEYPGAFYHSTSMGKQSGPIFWNDGRRRQVKQGAKWDKDGNGLIKVFNLGLAPIARW